MLRIENASKAFKKKVLFRQLNLTLVANKVTVLLGRNGVGKSTLLHIFAGLEKLDSGNIKEGNQSLSKKELQKKIGFVPQEIALWEHLTIAENIRFFKDLKKNAISDEQVLRFSELLQLKDFHQPVEQLSGGTKRKANLLIGLLHQPQLLILDEPTVGIDLKSRFEIHRLIEHLKNQCTIIMTTHHLDEVEAVADNIVLLGEDSFYQEVLMKANMPFEKL